MNETNETTPPRIIRPDAALVLAHEWTVDDPREQREAAEDALAGGPEPGLLSRNVYLGTDGHTVLRYSQWTAEANPGERGRHYRRYRSFTATGPNPTPGIIVVVRFDTDGEHTARKFVDTLFETVPGFTEPAREPDGNISSNFHLSTDGRHVLNYAEFVDEEAHQRTVETALRADDPVPRMINETPGLVPLGFRRFRFYRAAPVGIREHRNHE
ncbi:antibiotic biosynthesis monooxygenase [Amycolatopsis cihanbeyliensis]|uniref:Antibiotic biosynthesis monooxygenase n=1 Tax=Amycolatopsis cihanbeyliensis TaxID=1128664 RepID=A0A542DLJ7_AMYCI|nr:antibiotic biosynthesis monooxygenase [Amycolatopsis cihanbeyliensis]TQJ03949.1 antibiotic biosynthesis monooxygenase [Amycolatopsis cihanbeyliensis]